MLTKDGLKEYRLLRNLSLRDVARYCDISHTMIAEIEKGTYRLTEHCHDEIVKGINRATQARIDGTFDSLKDIESKEIYQVQKEQKKKRMSKKTDKEDK